MEACHYVKKGCYGGGDSLIEIVFLEGLNGTARVVVGAVAWLGY